MDKWFTCMCTVSVPGVYESQKRLSKPSITVPIVVLSMCMLGNKLESSTRAQVLNLWGTSRALNFIFWDAHKPQKSLNTWDKNLLFKAHKSCIQDFPSCILLRLDFNSYMCLFVSMWVHLHHGACVKSEDSCRVLVLIVLPSLRQDLFATV